TASIAAGPGGEATPVEAPPAPAPEPGQAPPPPPQDSPGGGFFSKIGDFLQSPTGRQLTNTVTREITRSLFGTRRRR
ncbi:hypothetical protein ABT341_22910, partial [Pseudonocardia alni]